MTTVTVHFKDIKQQIRDQLSRAKRSVQVAVAWFTDEDLMSDLIEINKKGEGQISVQIIISNAKENFFNYRNLDRLVRAGIHLRVMNADQPFLHHKFCLIDNQTIINGSYNWTYYASSQNEENITIINVEPNDALFTRFKVKFDYYVKDERSTIYSRNIILKDANLLLSQYDQDQIELRKQFQDWLIQTLKEIKELNDRKPASGKINIASIEKSIERYGDSVNLVKKLLRDMNASGEPKSGLLKLAEWGRLDISFEKKALESPFSQLFTDKELETCQKLIKRLSR